MSHLYRVCAVLGIKPKVLYMLEKLFANRATSGFDAAGEQTAPCVAKDVLVTWALSLGSPPHLAKPRSSSYLFWKLPGHSYADCSIFF